jgi:hypothetical protein
MYATFIQRHPAIILISLNETASGARRAVNVNTKSAAAKTRFLMSGGGGGGLPFQPLSRRSESVGVCVLL